MLISVVNLLNHGYIYIYIYCVCVCVYLLGVVSVCFVK
jgi:hypothetical protein